MTIHFAASRTPSSSPLLRAANDNTLVRPNDGLLRDALKHFAEHGLGAAEAAQSNAEDAFFAGDREEYRRWSEICRTLDRRMAAAMASRHDPARSR